MDKNRLSITKNSGEKEPFSMEKFKESLQVCGVKNDEVESIVQTMEPQLYDGITSNEIHKRIFPLLKKYNRLYASKYNLKRAIFDLGPTGYPFEKMVSALLHHKGYNTKVGVILQGECVTHEIDVLAEKDGDVYAIECKFHSKSDYSSNVKTPLYINSRFLDIQKKWNSDTKNKTHLKQGWLVTNTRFTTDAINYAKCVGLTLLSWDYPKNNGINKNIDEFSLYPVTALTTLTQHEKEQLIAMDVILIKELSEKTNILGQLKFSPNKIKQVLSEVHQLCRI
ncbi:restriction endonuclease [Maribacter sp. ANRC-HE7]|uniref:Restriction endonuclease n=1 Tax=Maribacter aquimaris TaxID=2737171 RepID=A0ABR7V386_9FLAO|nr:ATP cone domain-containing protein [Maribacter aquimaris]MBD0778400.1 restriction endonuclease [Maribacter aquimaris]